jgi:hypothetical protein
MQKSTIIAHSSRKPDMTEEVISAYLEGVNEETIMRIFDLTYPELCAIIMAY